MSCINLKFMFFIKKNSPPRVSFFIFHWSQFSQIAKSKMADQVFQRKSSRVPVPRVLTNIAREVKPVEEKYVPFAQRSEDERKFLISVSNRLAEEKEAKRRKSSTQNRTVVYKRRMSGHFFFVVNFVCIFNHNCK